MAMPLTEEDWVTEEDALRYFYVYSIEEMRACAQAAIDNPILNKGLREIPTDESLVDRRKDDLNAEAWVVMNRFSESLRLPKNLRTSSGLGASIALARKLLHEEWPSIHCDKATDFLKKTRLQAINSCRITVSCWKRDGSI